MTSLTAIFGSSQEQDVGKSDKLLELYWNRAELKKEFASLRDQTFRLREELKDERSKTARARQKVEHLENLLSDPLWVHNVMVFYQLRALNELCTAQVAQFAEQLKRQRERRQHSKLVEEWSSRRQHAVTTIRQKLDALNEHMQLLEKKLHAERNRYAAMNALMRFFRKRSVKRTLDRIADDIASAERRKESLDAALAKSNTGNAPETEGLSVASKRSVNLSIIAFAQQLYLHFSDQDLAEMAKESGEKSVGTLNYGDRNECDFLLNEILAHCDFGGPAIANAETLQIRARFLTEEARFRSDEDAVPLAESVRALYDVRSGSVVKKKGADLLGENYWDLTRVLSR